MEYDTRGVFPAAALAPGRTVLGVGPSLVGERGVGYRFLQRGLAAGEGGIAVTTTKSAAQVQDAVAADAAQPDAPLAVITTDGNAGGGVGGNGTGATDELCRSVSSPADLTGLGIAITEAIEILAERGTDRFRLVIDSLSPLAVYNEFQRVYRFLHVVLGRISTVGGTAFCYLPSNTVEERTGAVRGLADGMLEFREGTDGPEYRLQGLPDAPDEWRPVPDEAAEPATGSDAPPAADERGGNIVTPSTELPASLHELIERLAAERRTLTVYNYDGDTATLETLETYFDRLNVDVRTVETAVETPRNTTVLHRGSEPTDMAPFGALSRAVRVEESDTDADAFGPADRPTLLRRAEGDNYRVDDDGKRYLVDVSRLIEQQALDVGRGTLHAGFQRLDRLTDQYGTRRVYERLAASPVTVHLYGEHGTVPDPGDYHLHTAPDGELTEAWFVAFDGGGDDDRKVALVCEETAPGRYRGFWTRRPELVDETIAYLQQTYPVPAGPAQ
jgi:KaiC/GvpD/RAD55 family RecA-like ATPase